MISPLGLAKTKRGFFLFRVLFGSWLMLGLRSYAYAYDDPFFLSGIANGVKENHIYSYLTKRNIVLSSISIFQSRRRGTMSAKICIPPTFAKSVLEEDFWPKYVHCKVWQQKEIIQKSELYIANENAKTQSYKGSYSTCV